MQTTRHFPVRLISLGALMLALTSPSFATPPDNEGFCPPELPHPHDLAERQGPGLPPPPPFLHRVKLSDAQKGRIFELTHQQMPLLREHEIKSARALDELRKLGSRPAFDAEHARKLASEIGASQGEILLLQTQTEPKIYALLTPEQLAAANLAAKKKMPH